MESCFGMILPILSMKSTKNKGLQPLVGGRRDCRTLFMANAVCQNLSSELVPTGKKRQARKYVYSVRGPRRESRRPFRT